MLFLPSSRRLKEKEEKKNKTARDRHYTLWRCRVSGREEERTRRGGDRGGRGGREGSREGEEQQEERGVTQELKSGGRAFPGREKYLPGKRKVFSVGFCECFSLVLPPG